MKRRSGPRRCRKERQITASGPRPVPTTNHIPLIRPGQYAEPVTDYRLLNTIETSFGVAPIGSAATESPIADVFS